MTSFLSFEPGVVLHCRRRLEPSTYKALKDAYSLGVDTPGLKKWLDRGLYNPVLCAIWGERDLKRRVEWLRANADLHVPLMFELAIAEFEIEPAMMKVLHVSMPLLNAAIFRAHQDARCLKDYSEDSDFDEDMYKTYNMSLRILMKEYYPDVHLGKLILKHERMIKEFTVMRLGAIAERTRNRPETLPSPAWIGYDLEGKLHPMKSPDEIRSIRKDYQILA